MPRYAAGPERNQTPFRRFAPNRSVFREADDRCLLSRRHVEIRRKLPVLAHEIEFSLDRQIIVASTHVLFA